MKAIVGSIPEDGWLVLVLLEVLDVPELVMNSVKVLKVVGPGAHPDPKILGKTSSNVRDQCNKEFKLDTLL